jgi:hypothetical protein
VTAPAADLTASTTSTTDGAAAALSPRTMRRVLRRETHSPRAGLAIVVATLGVVVALWLAVELVLSMLRRPPVLVSPLSIIDALVSLDAPWAGAAGVGVAVLGALLILAGVGSGRRARHVIIGDRAPALVDNEVIASALARVAAESAGVPADNVVVSVSHRSATVRVTPISGHPVDRDTVSRAVERRLEGFALAPSVRSAVSVNASGVIGG